MKSWKKPTPELIEKALSSAKKETDRMYFFTRLQNPLWLQPLIEQGYFKSPPGIRHLPDGSLQFPDWPELNYLINIVEESVDRVIDTVLSLPKTDNPKVYNNILHIALKIKGSESSRLLPKIIEYTEIQHQFFAHDYPKLLCHWVTQGNITQALEVAKKLLPFLPDPKVDEKRQLRKVSLNSSEYSLKPIPRFREWEYQEIFEESIRPLAVHDPLNTAIMLLDVTVKMIWLKFHGEDIHTGMDQDYSEIWCRRLDHSDRNHLDSKEILVHTLFYTCQQVFDHVPDSIEALDQKLRKPRWRIFKRIRQNLYALHPSEQTLPWIREFIMDHEDYGKNEYHYEFQLMIKSACNYFGLKLLNEDDKVRIFDTIINGPSKDSFREWLGDNYTEEYFLQRQRYFHWKQLHPFAPLFSNDHKCYFDELAKEHQGEQISNEAYFPYGEAKAGWVTYQSPKTTEELSSYSDLDLLTYINEWDLERRDNDNWLIEINISALADVFQTLFKEKIVSDERRLSFWMSSRESIKRPVYIVTMTKAMQEITNDRNFDNLDQWLSFSQWILTHTCGGHDKGVPGSNDEPRARPEWEESRRAVLDFIDVCLSKNVNAPITIRVGLAKLLNNLCTQFDWRLDCNQPVLLNCDDPITEAINNTRSRALESLINFGFWVRGYLEDDPISEVWNILNRRVETTTNIVLTKPEYALLGMNFGKLCALNRNWALENKNMLFPQNNKSVWRAAFGNFLKYTHPNKSMIDILQENFEFALDQLETLTQNDDSKDDFVDRLGEHLFVYFVWGVYPLTGENSLLARFYVKTDEEHLRWAHLFDYAGRAISDSGEHFEQIFINRVIDFFNWRFEQREPVELQKFTFWLQAECLDPRWRLDTYSKVLDLCQTKDVGLSIEIETLNTLLANHLNQVVKCFAKITDKIDQDSNFYILTDEAKLILTAGLSSQDPQIIDNAKRARENLLKIGRFDFLEVAS